MSPGYQSKLCTIRKSVRSRSSNERTCGFGVTFIVKGQGEATTPATHHAGAADRAGSTDAASSGRIRKRGLDRNAQRNARERTKKKIA